MNTPYAKRVAEKFKEAQNYLKTNGFSRSTKHLLEDIENSVETRLKNAEHIYNQIDLASDRLHQFWGKGSNILDIEPVYDLNFLSSSTEFQNAAMQIIVRKGRLIQINERIGEDLESFLAVLEDY